MLITCKCLNLSINADNVGIQKIDLTNLNLSISEQSETFFHENIGTVVPINITKEQPGLLQVQNVNNWTINRCLNCNMYTHAIRKENSARTLLINMNLLTRLEDINALRSSDKYSSVFKIVLDHPEIDLDTLPTFTKYTVSQQSDPLKTPLSALQQQLSENIQKEVTETERRVRNYSELQYAKLEEFRERIHREHRVLASIIWKSVQKSPEPVTPLSPSRSKTVVIAHTPTSEVSPAKHVSSGPTMVLTATINTNPVLNLKDKDPRNKSYGLSKLTKAVSNNLAKRQSIDSEGLFDLEGFTENENLSDYSETEQDESGPDSSDDEGLMMSRSSRFQQKVNNSSIAKSLPISVPAFMGPRTQELDSDSDMMPEDGMDIAASIKALAKSVHGDTVFGDLPRPRFSTQI